MPEIFQGWKRKVGCVVLLMACAFAAGWARSLAVGDMIEFATGQGGTIHEFASESGAIQWRCCETSGYANPLWVTWRVADIPRGRFIDREFSHLIFRYADEPSWDGNASCPYWMVAVPLTSLSVYLLLSKPRVTKQKPESA